MTKHRGTLPSFVAKAKRKPAARRVAKIACPTCGEPTSPLELLVCPRCLKDGCAECIPGGRYTLCVECDDAEATST